MATADLFASGATTDPSANAPGAGLLVTNHLNLMYMLAAGLVMPPAGFGDKYYRDPLECFPGWIPLFVDKVPREAIESSVQEAGHLGPTIVRIGLSGMSGSIVGIGEHGSRELHFPDQLDGTERVLLFPAPLPTSRIDSIDFESTDIRRACERDAKDFGNVPLEDFKRGLSKTRFTKAPDLPWPPPGEGPAARTAVPLERPLAVGGVMAMLLLFGNLGDRAVRASRDSFDPSDAPLRPFDGYPIPAGLATWVREGVAPPPMPPPPEADRTTLQRVFQATLFWEVVERVIRWREDAGGAGGAEGVLLDHLAEASERLDPRVQAGIRKLHDTLESLTGLGDATASELFERHDTPLGRAMILFFLRRDGADLLDYRSDRLGEPDWLAAAILFGVRDGWLRLPLRLRNQSGLSAAVSHRMAEMSHRIAGTDLDLGEPPPRVRPLRECLGDSPSGWRRQERDAALALAWARKWDCVNTRIKLGAGEYKLEVKGGSTYLELPGEPRISPEIDRERFFDLLAEARLDSEGEAKAREKLRG